jgi:hypothetical protein
MDDGSGIGSGIGGNTMSPRKMRNGFTARNDGGRPRPMRMLKAAAAGKNSGIPVPGGPVKVNGTKGLYGGGGRSGILENIAKMGAGRY